MDHGKHAPRENDKVNHPSHYTFGDIEVIDYIRDKLNPIEFQGYCIGNVMKYISRWRHKGGAEDLSKAEVYLKWAIESAEKSGLIPVSDCFGNTFVTDYVNPDLNKYPDAASTASSSAEEAAK